MLDEILGWGWIPLLAIGFGVTGITLTALILLNLEDLRDNVADENDGNRN